MPVVSVDRQSVSEPVSEKVMDDMRSCGAAIIHVDADRKIVDDKGEEHMLLNPNVLIEIGAAMAFYGRRFILLVRDGVKLPSNLQGLYEVRSAQRGAAALRPDGARSSFSPQMHADARRWTERAHSS